MPAFVELRFQHDVLQQNKQIDTDQVFEPFLNAGFEPNEYFDIYLYHNLNLFKKCYTNFYISIS